jgi:hypothetical protein
MANNISTDVQEVAFAYLSEPRENLSGALEWNVGLNVPITSMQQFEDAALEEIADKQKAGRFPKPTPSGWNTPWKDSYKKEEDGTKTKVDDHNLVVFKRKVERKMRGEIVRNNPPVIFDSLGQKVPNPPKLGSGSKVKVIYNAFAYDTAVKGVQFQLVGLQIVELKAAASEISVAPVEGGWQAEREGIDELQAILND